jgi:hypothetical protein
MERTNKKIIWVILFILSSVLLINVGLNGKPIFKPSLITKQESSTVSGIGPNAGTYTITKNVQASEESPLEVPTRIGLLMAWLIAWIGLIGAFISSVAGRVLVFVFSIPGIIYALFATAFIKNF